MRVFRDMSWRHLQFTTYSCYDTNTHSCPLRVNDSSMFLEGWKYNQLIHHAHIHIQMLHLTFCSLTEINTTLHLLYLYVLCVYAFCSSVCGAISYVKQG